MFFTHHRPHLADRDMDFFTKARERGWVCEQVLTRKYPVRGKSLSVWSNLTCSDAVVSLCSLRILVKRKSAQPSTDGVYHDRRICKARRKARCTIRTHSVSQMNGAKDREIQLIRGQRERPNTLKTSREKGYVMYRKV